MGSVEIHPEQKAFNRKLKLSIQHSTEGDISRTQSISSSINLNEISNLKKLKKKPKPFSIHMAPLNTPMESRLQTLGIIWHTISIPVFILLFLFTLCLGWIAWVVVILPYFIWWYGFDLHTPSNGKCQYRYQDWMRNLIIWEWFVNYFPIHIHKSCELEPTFQNITINESQEAPADDELDLISEDASTIIDSIFKKLGLSKRLNRVDNTSSEKRTRKVSVGPRYIFGYHPHGVISMGVMGSFATNIIQNVPFEAPSKLLKPLFHDTTGKPQLFPNLGRIFAVTLSTQFVLPFYRDYLMSLGLTSAAGRNIKSLIKNGDNSIVLVVGGAQESLLNDVVVSKGKRGYKDNEISEEYEKEQDGNKLRETKSRNGNGNVNGNETDTETEKDIDSNIDEDDQDQNSISSMTPRPPKEIKLVLNKRKGFVKIAMELGNVSLVPIFAFGEADIYNVNIPKQGSVGYKFQHWMKKIFSFTVPFFSARGVFIYDFGFLPYRNPINLCIGRPIHIPNGVVEDYINQHPEYEAGLNNSPTQQVINLQRLSRSNSFSNLFKLNQRPKKPQRSTNIPGPLLDKYHKLYVDELKRVYEENKDNFGYGDVVLNISE